MLGSVTMIRGRSGSDSEVGSMSVADLMRDLEESVRADRVRRGVPLEAPAVVEAWSWEDQRQRAVDREAERRKEAREGW